MTPTEAGDPGGLSQPGCVDLMTKSAGAEGPRRSGYRESGDRPEVALGQLRKFPSVGARRVVRLGLRLSY